MSLFTNLLWEQREGKEEMKRQGPGASCSDPSAGRLHAEAMEPGAFRELPATACWISQGGCAGEESASEHVSLLEEGRKGVPGSSVAPSKRCRQARPGTRSGGLVSPQPRGAAQSHCPQMTQPPWAFHVGINFLCQERVGGWGGLAV